MIWFEQKRGYLADRTTQVWVKATGKQLELNDYPWLDGPIGPTHKIGAEYFDNLAMAENLTIRKNEKSHGIVPDFEVLKSDVFDPKTIHRQVIDFYQKTSEYELDAWSQWRGAFRAFGWLLAILFSRRLQQLNVPLTGLDTSRGITNEVWHLIEPSKDTPKYAIWIRHLIGSNNVLYAGSYGPCKVPDYEGVCLKVVFPLPNGNALVIMRPEAYEDGSISLTSSGDGFGSPGFYFVVHGDNGIAWARYVKTMRESIHVYPINDSETRADHILKIWGFEFLRLHYRMRRIGAIAGARNLTRHSAD